MKKIIFAAISPHPPILLPSVGSQKNRTKVKETIDHLKDLGEKLKKENPDVILISSPHPDWGFNVPLFFLAKDFPGETRRYLLGGKNPEFYFQEGQKTYKRLEDNKEYAVIASGDLSHCLKKDGPYGFHPEGPKFDEALIKHLKEKNIEKILKLNEEFPHAAECGLRSFCFLLGILEASGAEWEANVLSHEGPFGVGYLVTEFKLEYNKE